MLASGAMSRPIRWLLVAALWVPLGCGGGGGTNGDKCRSACDPSSVMECATMDSAKCQQDCEALTAGLSATCATCLTQGNAWKFARDQRGSGSAGCHGYEFPSITDSSSIGCANFCK